MKKDKSSSSLWRRKICGLCKEHNSLQLPWEEKKKGKQKYKAREAAPRKGGNPVTTLRGCCCYCALLCAESQKPRMFPEIGSTSTAERRLLASLSRCVCRIITASEELLSTEYKQKNQLMYNIMYFFVEIYVYFHAGDSLLRYIIIIYSGILNYFFFSVLIILV